MSDLYSGGCSKKDVTGVARVLVLLVSFASWLIPPRGRHRRP